VPVPKVQLIFIAVCAALAAGALHAQDAALPDANALFARGVALHQRGDILGAIEAYGAALEKDPERVDARSNLGAAYVRLGRYDEAIGHYRAVLARLPDQAQVRFNLALALYKGARTAEAADELARVVEKDPANRSALLLLADCHLQMGDDAKVVDLLVPREEELKEDRLFAYLMGTALLRRNELMKGQSYIDRLFKGGDAAEGHLLMGVALIRKGDHRAALPELQKAVQMKPDLPAAHALLGRALMAMGRRDDAAAAFREELGRNPNDFDSNLYLGMLLKDDQKLDQAYEHLKRAARLRSQDTGVLYGLGALHLAAGRTDEARKLLETVVEKAPDYRQGHVLLATAYYRQKDKAKGDREQAIAEKLREEQQSREPGAAEDLGPGYKGENPVPAPPEKGRP
jgi:tetratricopeptide (TPR) repeat protein